MLVVRALEISQLTDAGCLLRIDGPGLVRPLRSACFVDGRSFRKCVGGVRSIVSRLGSAHRSRLQDIANCPRQFQEHVAERGNRLHIVGDECFASEIGRDADDYGIRWPFA